MKKKKWIITSVILVVFCAGLFVYNHYRGSSSAADPAEKRREKVREYEEKFSGPDFAAKNGYVDDIIEPCETRLRLINAIEANLGKRQALPAK